uniref:HORMA domain-containing protein n=1 Tax=Parascaris univalens TaxID=6257 RepID=A0A915BVU7_PARUN
MQQLINPKTSGVEAKDVTWWERTTVEDESEDDSTKVVRGVLSLLISQIFYHRRLLSPKHFASVRISKVKAPVLADETKQGKSFWRMMDSILDAIQKRYLYQIIVVLADKDRKDIGVFEVYKFIIRYADDGCRIVIRGSDGQSLGVLTYKGKKEMRRQVAALLLDIHALTTSFKDLPECTVPLVKLRYYSNTPLDYEPLGFRRADSWYRFDRKPDDFYLGSFQSKILRCSIKAESLFSPSSTTLPSASHFFKTQQKDSVTKSMHEDTEQRGHKQERTSVDDPGSHDQHQSSGTVKAKETMVFASSVRSATEIPRGPQRSTSGGCDKFHSSLDDAEEVLAGNLVICERKHDDATTTGHSVWRAEQQDSRMTVESMRHGLHLLLKGSIQKRGAAIDIASDKSAFDWTGAVDSLVSQYISPLGSSANSLRTEIGDKRNEDQGASRNDKGDAFQKHIHGSSDSIFLSSSSSVMPAEPTKGDLNGELQPRKKRKVSRMSCPRFQVPSNRS